MKQLEYRKGEEVVFCPIDHTNEYGTNRGADGVITHRETTKKGSRVRVKSFLVKWRLHRKGVSSFRVKGKKRPKSDWFTAIFEKRLVRDKRRATIPGVAYHKLSLPKRDVSRFEESVKHLHPTSYCRDCPLRLRRLVTPCNMSKAEAIERYGEVKE